jgi:hypothetical protein
MTLICIATLQRDEAWRGGGVSEESRSALYPAPAKIFTGRASETFPENARKVHRMHVAGTRDIRDARAFGAVILNEIARDAKPWGHGRALRYTLRDRTCEELETDRFDGER